MTPTTPTPGAEPHQPGEREALARAGVAADRPRPTSGPLERMFGIEDVDPLAQVIADALDWTWQPEPGVPSPAEAAQPAADAALAHLAERRAGDVEAVNLIAPLFGRTGLFDRMSDAGYGHLWAEQEEARKKAREAIRRLNEHAQIAALTPTRGVSAEQRRRAVRAVIAVDRGEADADYWLNVDPGGSTRDHAQAHVDAVLAAIGIEVRDDPAPEPIWLGPGVDSLQADPPERP